MAGGIQAFVKSQQIVPGECFVLVGTHPLQIIVADQILKAGGKVAGVYFGQPLSRFLRAFKAPATLFRFSGKFLFFLGCICRVLLAGVGIHFGRTVRRALGKEALEQVELMRLDSQGQPTASATQAVAADRLGLCFSFIASSELARQLGATVRWSAPEGGFLVEHDQWMQSSVPGLFVAGEITAVAGADAAMEEGRLAAFGIIRKKMGAQQCTEFTTQIDAVTRRLQKHEQFSTLLRALSDPEDIPKTLLKDEAIVCKCEQVSVGDIHSMLTDNQFVSTASSLKLLTRAGMGLCQGRYCQHILVRLIAEQRNIPEQQVGPYTAQFPSKPLAVAKILEWSPESQ
ncbi:(2Fe-2S)-binding protein [Pseudomaricurvus hydrocarbonicus]